MEIVDPKELLEQLDCLALKDLLVTILHIKKLFSKLNKFLN